MSLVLNEEERMLQDAAKAFLSADVPVSALRALRDTRDETGFSRATWHAMSEMGWSGLLIPEAAGGLGFSHVGAGVIAEQCGRTLAASPLLSSAILSAVILREAATDAQQQQWLPGIADGSRLMAVALDESIRHAPLDLVVSARRDDQGWHLNTCKSLVLDGHVADALIVVARSAGESGQANGVSLFVVDPSAEGVTIERCTMVDSHNAANVVLNDVVVNDEALIGQVGQAWPALERALDVARVMIAAELLGLASEAFERTIDYLKQRKQFGTLIGGFQALQHRCADLFCELELTRSAVMKALRELDDPDADVRKVASIAKAKAVSTATLAVNEAVQMHGGIGMTDEYEIGFFMKRAAVLRQLLGDGYFHTNRFASLAGI